MNDQNNERKAFIKSFSERVRYATDIQWETDEGEKEPQLPEEIEIPDRLRSSDLEGVADYLSAITGYLHTGYILKPKETRLEEVLRAYDETGQTSEAGHWRVNPGAYDLYWELMYSKNRDWNDPDFRVENLSDELHVTRNRIAEPEDIAHIIGAISRAYNFNYSHYISTSNQKLPVKQPKQKSPFTKKQKTR